MCYQIINVRYCTNKLLTQIYVLLLGRKFRKRQCDGQQHCLSIQSCSEDHDIVGKNKIPKQKLKIEENSKRENQKLKHIKRSCNNFHIPDLVQAFYNVENGGSNLVL